VLITSRKLQHYFQEYSISVVTDYPLGDILRNQDATGRISKWAVELGALNIDFKPRTAIKSQALVDFMAKWRENQLPTPIERPEHWVMYFDSSLNLEGAGAGVLLISSMGEQFKYVLQIVWKVLTVDYRIKVHMDLQADKSPVVVKGPFFPRVVNPRYRICGTMCNARIQSSKARKAIL
jgi:hypothetical protein